MANLAKILGIPLIAAATLIGCPMQPDYPHGTVNVKFNNAPYSYKVDITAWDGDFSHVNSVVGSLNPGQKSTSFDISPDFYLFNAYGNDSSGNSHNALEDERFTVEDGKSYTITWTMN